ncbi:MAG TPA: hypothetical protein VHH88_08605 [Verrucomicrobiae bacterium]|nr:hypothetical protein [Verrucomicrobiae bacterium]
MNLQSTLLEQSRIIREPVGKGNGYWAGAPGACYDSAERAWYVTYRLRRPRGVEPDRGGETRIARSSDLQTWEDIWSCQKKELNSASIERSALRKGSDGLWRNFISYVDQADGRWCLSVLTAPKVAELKASNAKPVFKAAALGLEGVKDPWIFSWNGTFQMLLSVALPTPKTGAGSHSTLDIFNTGECASATALATSPDLEHWTWQGVVFSPEGSAWDQYCRRINSVVAFGKELVGFYDGSASHHENYEERTGLATSTDLRKWRSQTPDGPALTSPHASHCLRYIDAQPHADGFAIFFEMARADGAHELRLATVPRGSLESWHAALSKAGS